MNSEKNYDFERELPSTPLNPQMIVSTNHIGRAVGDSVNDPEAIETANMILNEDEM